MKILLYILGGLVGLVAIIALGLFLLGIDLATTYHAKDYNREDRE